MATRDWLLIVLLGAIWGTSFIFNGLLLPELAPVWISAGRVTVAALGCWAYFIFLGKKIPKDPMIYVHGMVLGTISYAIPFSLYPLAQGELAAGVASIINAMTPIMTVLVSHFWLGGEKVTWGKMAGVVAGFIGVAILSSNALMSGGSSDIWAIVMCLAATFCYAIALNYTRGLGKIDPVILATFALTGASVSAVPAAFIVHGMPGTLSLAGWGALLGIGLMATTFAFQVVYAIIPRVGATNISVTTFIAPISTIILGAMVLNEALRVEHFAGMVAIFIGLLLIDGRILKRKRRAQPEG